MEESVSVVYYYTRIYAGIPAGAGTGPVLGVVVTIDTPGTYDVGDYPAPAGVPVTVEMWGGGGGGGGPVDGGPAGGGGGGGGYLRISVPAALWSAGGSLVVGAGGAGSAVEDQPGAAGEDTTLTLDAIEVANAGQGGAGPSVGGGGGVGGLNATTGDVTTVSDLDGGAGGPGAVWPITDGGAGGAPGAPGAGAGGQGADYPSGAGESGGGGMIRLTYITA